MKNLLTPHDEYARLLGIREIMPALESLQQSAGLSVLAQEYQSALSLTEIHPALEDYNKYLQQSVDAFDWNKITGISGAAERAMALLAPLSDSFRHIEKFHKEQSSWECVGVYDQASLDATLPGLSSDYAGMFGISSRNKVTEDLLDTYHRATAWLAPLQALSPAQLRLSELEKYRSLIDATDPLRLYRDALGLSNEMSILGVPRHLLEVFEALDRVSHDISASSSSEATWDTDDLDFDDTDVERVNNLVHSHPVTMSLSPETITAFVQEWVDAYENLPSVRDRKIFTTYIYPVLLSLALMILNPYGDFIVKQKLEAANRTSKKSVRMAVRGTNLPSHVIDNFRFVGAQRLNVRQNGRMNAPTIGVLSFGQPVEVMKKDRDWTLVHYTDSEAGIAIQGWVLSRYLKRYR